MLDSSTVPDPIPETEAFVEVDACLVWPAASATQVSGERGCRVVTHDLIDQWTKWDPFSHLRQATAAVGKFTGEVSVDPQGAVVRQGREHC
jgi:hypothetical protein